MINGFEVWAPEFAREGGGYSADLFGQIAPLEERSFWFQARNWLIRRLIRQHMPSLRSYLEIGCGTGFVTRGVAEEFPAAELTGSEIFVDGLAMAARRVPTARLVQMDARNLPSVAEFDVVGAFDVIEHIEEDERVMANVHRALRPDGLFVITVPQHGWLWSPADDHAHHVRRYSARELHEKLNATGFEVLRSTSFVTILLPAMLLSRMLQRRTTGGEYDPWAELRIPGWLNRILGCFMKPELWLIKWGMNLPVGGSRLVVARRIG